MRNPLHILLLAILFSLVTGLLPKETLAQNDQLYRISNSSVQFKSNAPLELIQAVTTNMSGILDPSDGTFALSIPITSFLGFNSPLQKEHFNANYLESHKYKTATFVGRIIEDIDFAQQGEQKIRAKGKLTIHNVAQERIIDCTLNVAKSTVEVSTEFIVLLRDHNISIPKIVEQKISTEITVTVEAAFITENSP